MGLTMKTKPLSNAAYFVSALGVLFHLYLTLFHSTRGSFYYIIIPLINVLPYLLCMVLVKLSRKPLLPLCSCLMLLLFDVYLFHKYFFSTRTYRFQVIEYYLIMFKTVVILPAGCLIGYLSDKIIQRRTVKRTD